MADQSQDKQTRVFSPRRSQFWAGDEGLTLLSIVLLVGIFIFFPVREAFPTTSWLVPDIALSILMVSAALAVRTSRILTAVIIVITVAALVVRGIARVVPSRGFQEFSTALIVVSLLLFAFIVLLVVFQQGPIKWKRIQGGVAAYLLLGLVWAFAYQLAEQIHPGAIQFATAVRDPDQLIGKLVYFSFVTLTTVGYGDISAVHPLARSLAMGEALVGQLFPAILIATLVTMAMQARHES